MGEGARQVRPDTELLGQARRRALAGDGLPGPEALAGMLRERRGLLGREDLAVLAQAVRAEVSGAGPLQPLLELPGVTDVLVNGPGSVWLDRGCGLERVEVDVGDAERIRGLAVRLAGCGGQRLDDAAPVVDARLPDGTRLHAVLPPVAGESTLISLRVPHRRGFDLDELVAAGMVAPRLRPVLEALVARRTNALVSGSTGTGKTTLLGTLLGLVPGDERVVVIEEAAELEPRHPHVVRLTARRPNVEGAGEVDLADLVRHALRMRPDRIVLGECRGAEVREVLTALNTGHDGGWATVHANTAADVPARLEALGALAGMSRAAVAAQAASALDAVVHLDRDGTRRGGRQVAQVGVVVRDGSGLRVVPAVECSGAQVRPGPAWARLAARCALGPWPGGDP